MQVLFSRRSGQIPKCIDQATASAARGFAAHRATARANLHNALRGVYPVVERLVGMEFFAFAAHAYITRNRSTSGNLNLYGTEFPAFISSFRPAATLPYLADVAALEWALHEVYAAAEASPVSPLHLATMAPEHYGRLTCSLHPATRLLRSAFPIQSIWEKNQPGYAGDPSVDLRQEGDHLLIRRTAAEMAIERVSAADWRFLSLLAQGRCLEETLIGVSAIDQAFDLAAALRRYYGTGVLIDVRLPPAILRE
jgi:hypothetical protein